MRLTLERSSFTIAVASLIVVMAVEVSACSGRHSSSGDAFSDQVRAICKTSAAEQAVVERRTGKDASPSALERQDRASSRAAERWYGRLRTLEPPESSGVTVAEWRRTIDMERRDLRAIEVFYAKETQRLVRSFDKPHRTPKLPPGTGPTAATLAEAFNSPEGRRFLRLQKKLLQRTDVDYRAWTRLMRKVQLLRACNPPVKGAPTTTSATVPAGTLRSSRPPAPATWPAYPRFSEHSCWARPLAATTVMRSAPSVAPEPHGKPAPPAEIVRRLLARFGDRTYVHGIEIGSPPARSRLKGFFPGRRPPSDALWAYIDAPGAVEGSPTASAAGAAAVTRARWEAELIGGALRDDFCSAGGRSLAGWSIGDQVRGVSDGTFALGQRFPNPSRKTLRARVGDVGERYGFRIASLRLLRPRELAPLLVVETSRDRKAFVDDVPAIMPLLNPRSNGSGQSAVTFEGMFFEARDDRGTFLRVFDSVRGAIVGGQWSWDPCVYPYEHSEPVGARACAD